METGVYYAEKVIQTKYPGWPSYYDRTNLKTIDVPLLFKLNFRSDKFNFFVGGGIEGSYILSMKNHYNTGYGENFYWDTFGPKGDKLVELLEQPFIFSAAASLGFCLGKFSFEARYLHGLADIKLAIQDDMLNRMVNVNAGKFRGIMLLIGYSIK